MKRASIITAMALIVIATIFAGCAVTVRTPPPPALVEVRPVVPFVGAVWIGGYYTYEHNRYVWIPGRYAKPPRRDMHWVPGYWKEHHRGWKWTQGYWR